MKTLGLTILFLWTFNPLRGQEIHRLNQSEIDSLMSIVLKYDFNALEPTDYFSLAISVNKSGCLYYSINDTVMQRICCLIWNKNTPKDWLSEVQKEVLTKYLHSDLACLPAKISNSSTYCCNEKSTLGKQIADFLSSQSPEGHPYPSWCSF